MGISKGKVNPLNVLNLRRLNKIPPNFAKIHLKNFFDIQRLDSWIYLNLDSRYCIRKASIIEDNKLITVVEVGIEDAKEITMMSLACPLLDKK
jgi:hypothetical protein